MIAMHERSYILYLKNSGRIAKRFLSYLSFLQAIQTRVFISTLEEEKDRGLADAFLETLC